MLQGGGGQWECAGKGCGDCKSCSLVLIAFKGVAVVSGTQRCRVQGKLAGQL